MKSSDDAGAGFRPASRWSATASTTPVDPQTQCAVDAAASSQPDQVLMVECAWAERRPGETKCRVPMPLVPAWYREFPQVVLEITPGPARPLRLIRLEAQAG